MARDTLVDFFADLSSIDGEFLVYDNGYRPRSFRYREMAGMAGAFVLRLRAAGIRKGDKVLIWSENRPGWIAALWGCILDGVVLVPLDYRVSSEFLLRISRVVNAKALVIGDEVARPDFAAAVWHIAEIEQEFVETFERVVDAAPDDTVQIVFTSGATAEPKGVVITHRNLLANMIPVEREIIKYKRYSRPFLPLRFLNLLPLSHLFGQSMATYIPPMLAGVVIFMKNLEPGEIVRQIHNRRVSVLVCVPKMLEVLRGFVTARFPETAGPVKPGPWWVQWWRYRRVHRALGFKFWAFVVGAAPLDGELEQFWMRLGFVVIQGYGLTETAPIVTLNHPFHTRKGSVGKAIAGVEIKIAPDGEILVRGANVSGGYYQGAEGGARVLEDGWLHTGDLGELAPDGSLTVHGRKKEVIVTPEGLNVYPEDIERVLEKIRGVKEAAVVGPDRVHAVLVLEPGTNPEDVTNAANQTLEEHQRIRTVHVWPGESLPRTEGTGKLKRVEIRAWLAGGAIVPTPAREGGVLDILRKLAPGRTITPETTLEDLGLSSLERVELMSGIEQQLGGERDEAALAGARRVSDLLNIPAATQQATEAYPRWSRSFAARLWRRLILPAVVFPLARYYARIEVHGRDHLGGLSGPAIFASNHQSYMDAPVILMALPKAWRYRVAPAMSKEFFAAHFHPAGHSLYERLERSLQYYLAVSSFNAFPLPQRESGVGGTLRYAGEVAASGSSILIFPEGQMTDDGKILPFQPGVALMASRLALPVVPVRIRGLEKVLHRKARWATRGRVRIDFGAPIRLPSGEWRDLARQVQDAVERL